MKKKSNVAKNKPSGNKRYIPPKAVLPEHQDFLTKVGKSLEELRETKKITALALATEVGISRTGYRQMERGLIYFHLQKLLQVLEYHQISASDFFKSIE